MLTAEGENFLLTQQTGRYLLKAYEQLRRGASADGPKIKYLENVDELLQGIDLARLLRTCKTDADLDWLNSQVHSEDS